MPTIIGYHNVKDTNHWLASPKREEFFGPLRVTNIRTFVEPQNRTQVAMEHDGVSTLDEMAALIEDLMRIADYLLAGGDEVNASCSTFHSAGCDRHNRVQATTPKPNIDSSPR
jgi:hypothetical protein